VVAELGLSANEYLNYARASGLELYEKAQQEAAEDHVFGVPLFLFDGEPFWGHDRLMVLEQQLNEAGLARNGLAKSGE
jgi:2-hydroxychromene-2-carboxylate isomerase